MGGRSICPPWSKKMVYNTGGRFQLDKPAPATVGRLGILGWGTARKAGASGEPGTAGEGPWGFPAKLFVAVVGWGRWERRAPPRLARLLELRQLVVGVCWCPYCVSLCMICAKVFPSSHPWHPQITADCVLVWGMGCLVLCAMARAKTLRVRTLWWYL